ncbi:hypothetical protein [Paralysiella testudinis]|uniref:Uncharacterized protein n=1 Tax=Paralysiella testudinis TaxID=2809020 RepID=A0A892ZKG4_9NEIS|nr:hypothetical protein [Paralysiella testudinis]QRQ82950.1 hypothetical protein JQU52_06145 [Paralysiella testudinis]
MPTHNTLPQWAAATLACQGLAVEAAFGAGKTAVLKAVQHLGYVQIDILRTRNFQGLYPFYKIR